MTLNKRFIAILGVLCLLALGAFAVLKSSRMSYVAPAGKDVDVSGVSDEDEAVPDAVPASNDEVIGQPSAADALGGYNVLIADRGNNRIIEVTPDKKIVWEYHFNLSKPGLGADDAFFANGGRDIIVNLENYQLIQLIDYQTKKVVWQYGHPGVRGSGDGYLSNPDDAYRLPNGDVIVADIKNCRILEIGMDKKIVRQYGQTNKCGTTPGLLNKPNGDTPLPNGHILISNIRSHNLIELDKNWQAIFSLTFPLAYPSDPQMTKAGNILISEYRNPGKIIEISRAGNVVWEFDGDGPVKMDRPSLAEELPNGNILANDDFNHRVIVIDKKTRRIMWQYGVTGKPGASMGQLNIPDGMDIIQHAPVNAVGKVTRHAQDFLGTHVVMEGYVIKKEDRYVIVSDEQSGAISSFDLPVSGPGFDAAEPGAKYVFEGVFTQGGLAASNGNENHLELTKTPQRAL